MKRVSALLALCLLFTLCACSGAESDPSTAPSASVASETASVAPSVEPSPSPVLSPEPTQLMPDSVATPAHLPTPDPSPSPEPSADADSSEAPPPGVPVGGKENAFSLDDMVYILNSSSGDDELDAVTIYDEDSNTVVTMVYLDGFYATAKMSFALDQDGTISHWEETLSGFADLDVSYRRLLNVSCDTEVNTALILWDSEADPSYIAYFDNGELYGDWLGMYFDALSP